MSKLLTVSFSAVRSLMKPFALAAALLATLPLAAQNSTAEATAVLAKAGLEDIRVFVQADTVNAAFSSSHIRGNYRLIGIALHSLAQQFPTAAVYRAIVLEHLDPKVAVTATLQGGQWQAHVSYDTRPLERLLQSERLTVANSSRGKIDLIVYPTVTWANYVLNKLAYVGFGLAPSVETTLWPGNRIYAQVRLPLFHNYNGRDVQAQPQLGVVGLRQDWFDNRYFRFATSAGAFLYNRVGLEADLTAHLTRTLDLGVRTHYSKYLAFAERGEVLQDAYRLSVMGIIDYYHPATALQLKVAAGTFAYGDLGLRADLVRHFGEHTVGLYGIYTEGEWNAGFNFSFPLMPRRLVNRDLIRLRIPQHFNWEYSLLSMPTATYVKNNYGETIKERPDQNFTAHYWQAAYLEHYLNRFLNGQIR